MEKEIRGRLTLDTGMLNIVSDSVVLMILFGSSLMVYRWSLKYHERRVLACSLIVYCLLYIIVFVFYMIDKTTLDVSLLLVVIEIMFTISRLLIKSASETFLMKILTHRVPAESFIYNAPFLLSVLELIVKFPPWSFSDMYLTRDIEKKSTDIGIVFLVALTV